MRVLEKRRRRFETFLLPLIRETPVSQIRARAPARRDEVGRIRKRVEDCFGWAKDGRPLRKMQVVGKAKVEFLTVLTLGCYALIRGAS